MKSFVTSILSLVAAFAVTGIVVAMIGESPFKVYGILFSSAFGSSSAVGYTIYYATPLIFTGLAVALGLHAGLFNIGAEGQLSVGAFLATIVGLIVPAGGSPWFWTFTAIVAAFLGGALWALIPGLLRAFRGGHEVINTIMMNMIAAALLSYLTMYHFRDPGTQAIETSPIHESVTLQGLYRWFPLPDSSPANVSFFLALGAAFLMYVFLWKSPWGYEIRAVGRSESAAKYAGISVRKNLVIAMLLSGGLAGLVGVNDILGNLHRYKDSFSPGYGFVGIAVALLGKNHPLGIVLSALLFGALHNASIALDLDTEKVSRDLVGVLEGVMILFVACEAVLHRYVGRKAKA